MHLSSVQTIDVLAEEQRKRMGLYALLGCLCLLVLGVGALIVLDLQRSAQESQQVYDRLSAGIEVVSNLQYETQETRRYLLMAQSETEREQQQAYFDLSRKASARVSRYLARPELDSLSPATARAASVLQDRWLAYVQVRDAVMQELQQGERAGATRRDHTQGQKAFAEVRHAVERLEELQMHEAGAQTRMSEQRNQRSRTRLVWILGLSLVMAGLATLALVRAARRSERQVREAIESLNEMVLVFDGPLRLVLWNATARPLLSNLAGPHRRTPLLTLLPELNTDPLLEALARARRTLKSVVVPSFQLWRGSQPQTFELSICPLEHGVTLVLKDVTTRELALRELAHKAQALQVSEERFALAIDGAADGIWDIDLQTQAAHYSSRWLNMVGLEVPPPSPDLDTWFSRVHREDCGPLRRAFAAHLEGLTPHFEYEFRLCHMDGSERWMLSRGLAVRNATGRATRIAGSLTDITERKRIEEQLTHSVLHDALTGLPNRTLFMDRLRQAMEHGRRRDGYGFAVLFLDMDRFKVVNDSLGHLIGDQLLIGMGQRVASLLRAGDTLARLGGDEFTVLLDDVTSVEQVQEVANRIQNAMKQPFSLAGQDIVVSLSIGIAAETRDYERPEDLLRDADTALYRAKHLGRARAELFDTAMHTRAVRRLQLETDLRKAVERQELVLFYQPIVVLEDGHLNGFEALLRWRHKELGLIAPLEFIPVAEETGLICSVGEWVLREACNQMVRWTQSSPALKNAFMSVNLAPRQLSQPELVDIVRQILAETGMQPTRLKLEITESTAMESAESACRTLTELSDLGIQIAIDDFGTGYSSLSYLHRFPATTLKIDRSFVDQIDSDSEKMEIIQTIVVMATNLGLDVVAEGIETDEQRQKLAAINCDQGQGYLFARPVDSQAITELLSTLGPKGNIGQHLPTRALQARNTNVGTEASTLANAPQMLL